MKVFVTDKTFPNYTSEIEELGKLGAQITFASSANEETFIQEGADADAVVTSFSKVTEGFINTLSNCKMIIRTGIGVDNIDVAAATKKGIQVAYVPDYCRDEVADHTLALMLNAARKLNIFDKQVRNGVWSVREAGYVPRLGDCKFGLLGFGGIAQRVAKRVMAFGITVIAYDPYLPDSVFESLGVERARTIDEIYKASDFISLNLPLNQETHHMINKTAIAKMKPNVFIINTARGPLINEDDLYEALKSGRVCDAGLDVFENEPLGSSKLTTLENVILTPHAAFFSVASLPDLQKKTFAEVYRALKGEPLNNCFNKKELGI